jgi:hypothetical protein
MAVMLRTSRGLPLSSKPLSRQPTCRLVAPVAGRAPFRITRCTLGLSAYRDQTSGGGGAVPDSPYAQEPKPAGAGREGLVDLYALDPEGVFADVGVKVRRDDLAVLAEPGDKLIHFRSEFHQSSTPCSILDVPMIEGCVRLQPANSFLSPTEHAASTFKGTS